MEDIIAELEESNQLKEQACCECLEYLQEIFSENDLEIIKFTFHRVMKKYFFKKGEK